MLRTFLKGFACCLAGSVLLLLVILSWVRPPAASSSSFPWVVDAFGAACKHPCLLGVQPGITSLEEAATLLRLHPLTKHLLRSTDTSYRSDDLYVFLVTDEAKIVTSISVNFRQEAVYFGDLLNAQGKPSAVELALFQRRQYRYGGYVSWIYDDVLFMTAWMEKERLISPLQPVEFLEVHRDPPLIATPIMMNAIPFTITMTPEWLGFGSVQKYLSHPECQLIRYSFEFEQYCPQ